jgi:hypothetical protein
MKNYVMCLSVLLVLCLVGNAMASMSWSATASSNAFLTNGTWSSNWTGTPSGATFIRETASGFQPMIYSGESFTTPLGVELGWTAAVRNVSLTINGSLTAPGVVYVGAQSNASGTETLTIGSTGVLTSTNFYFGTNTFKNPHGTLNLNGGTINTGNFGIQGTTGYNAGAYGHAYLNSGTLNISNLLMQTGNLIVIDNARLHMSFTGIDPLGSTLAVRLANITGWKNDGLITAVSGKTVDIVSYTDDLGGGQYRYVIDVTAIPEPATLFLLVAGSLALLKKKHV